MTAGEAAKAYYEAALVNDITVNIVVGWGEVAGYSLLPGSIDFVLQAPPRPQGSMPGIRLRTRAILG